MADSYAKPLRPVHLKKRSFAFLILAVSVATLLAVGGVMVGGSAMGRPVDLSKFLHQPWSYFAGIGVIIMVAVALRAWISRGSALAKTVTVSTEAVSTEAVTLKNFSSSLERWDPALRSFGQDVLQFFAAQSDRTVQIPAALLAQHLQSRIPAISGMDEHEIVRLLHDIYKGGYAPGLAKGQVGFYVPEYHMSFKLASQMDEKLRIGATAALLVESNSVISLDGGSTTLPIVEAVARRVDSEDLAGVTVVTNSYPIAKCIATLTEKRGWSDSQAPIRVVMPAGVVRPNTLAISPVNAESQLPVESLLKIFEETGAPSLAFVGANGLRADEGLTMPTGNELDIKDVMLRSASRPFVVADSSKFGVHHPIIIRTWADHLTLLTCRPTGSGAESEEVDAILNLPDRCVQITFANEAGDSTRTR